MKDEELAREDAELETEEDVELDDETLKAASGGIDLIDGDDQPGPEQLRVSVMYC